MASAAETHAMFQRHREYMNHLATLPDPASLTLQQEIDQADTGYLKYDSSLSELRYYPITKAAGYSRVADLGMFSYYFNILLGKVGAFRDDTEVPEHWEFIGKKFIDYADYKLDIENSQWELKRYYSGYPSHFISIPVDILEQVITIQTLKKLEQ